MKRLLLLFIVFSMVLSAIPSEAYVKPCDSVDDFTVSIFGDGTSNSASLLNDGFTYNFHDWYFDVFAIKKGYQAARPYNNLNYFVKFTEKESGIEFSWDSEQTVSRIDIWEWSKSLCPINEYEIQSSEDGVQWNKVSEGIMNNTEKLYDPDNGYDNNKKTYMEINNATVCSVVFDETVTKHLRFVIKSFNGEEEAYISEAIVTNKDEASFTTLYSNGGDKAAYSPYIEYFVMSGNDSSQASYNTCENSAYWRYCLPWACKVGGDVYNLVPDDFGNCFYAVGFNDYSKICIDKIELSAEEGKVSEFNVYYSNYLGAHKAVDDKSKWIPAGTYSGEEASNISFELSKSIPAKFWMVEITGYSGDLKIKPINMYQTKKYSFGTVSEGEATDADYTVKAFGENVSGDDGLLTDNFFFSHREWYEMGKKEGYGNVRPTLQRDKFVKFTGIDSGIEFDFNEETDVNRIDLWIWRTGGIKSYEVQISDDGEEWKKQGEGEFDQSDYIVDSLSNNAYYYSLYFEEVATKYLRFVIKSFKEGYTDAYIAEARYYSPQTYTNLTSISPLNTGKCSFSPYVTVYKVSNNSSGVATYNGKNDVVNGEAWPMVRDSKTVYNVVPDANNNMYYACNFSLSRPVVNRIKLNIASGSIYEYQIMYSNEADALSNPANEKYWNVLATVSGSFTSTSEIDIADAPGAKNWMINITQHSDDASLSPCEMYYVPENEINLFSRIINKITDVITDEKVITKNVSLPGSITIDGYNFTIDWECDSPYINTDTGELTVPEEDEKAKFTAKVTCPALLAGVTLSSTKEMVILGDNKKPRTTVLDEKFEGQNLIQNVTVESGEAAQSGGILNIASNSQVSLYYGLENSFVANGFNQTDILFGSSDSEGKAIVKFGNKDEIELDFGENEITVIDLDGSTKISKTDGIRITSRGGKYNLFTRIYGEWVPQIYNRSLINEDSATDCITFITGASQSFKLDSVKAEVESDELFKNIEQQFDFRKISENPPLGVIGDLKLIESLYGITFNYQSSDEAVLNPVSGKYTPGERKEITFTVNASNGTNSFSKSFLVITNNNNIFYNADVTTTAYAMAGSNASSICDNSVESGFTANTDRPYKVNIDFGKKVYFDTVSVYLQNLADKITSYTLSVSEDGKKYTDVASKCTMGNGENINIGLQYARYVRLSADELSGKNTGIAEICGYLSMSDEEKMERDIKALEAAWDLSDELSIEKKGEFGTEFFFTSSSPAVKITESNGKWKISTVKQDKEVEAVIKMTASNGKAELNKEYNTTIFGTGNIRDNSPKAESSGPGVSSSLSGSVTYSSGKAYAESTVPAKQALYNEISGHWGEKEIKTLIDKGIVSGDGNGLNLKGNVTRAEFLKMVFGAVDEKPSEYQNHFIDVNAGDWFAGIVQKGYELGIMQGDGIRFSPNAPITRQEMAVVMGNVIKNDSTETTNLAEIFSDYEDIELWAVDGISKVVGLGIIKGYEDKTFAPDKYLTRDEAMVVAYRLMNEIQRSEK